MFAALVAILTPLLVSFWYTKRSVLLAPTCQVPPVSVPVKRLPLRAFTSGRGRRMVVASRGGRPSSADLSRRWARHASRTPRPVRPGRPLGPGGRDPGPDAVPRHRAGRRGRPDPLAADLPGRAGAAEDPLGGPLPGPEIGRAHV